MSPKEDQVFKYMSLWELSYSNHGTAHQNVDHKGCVDEVLDGNMDFTRDWNGAHPCYDVVKNLKVNNPCPKTFLEAKFKVDQFNSR